MIGLSRLVYIAGPITGVKDGNKVEFSIMSRRLERLCIPHINPRSLEIPIGTKESEIQTVMMKLSLERMFLCDSVVLLDGWRGSKGAYIEYLLARYFGIPIFDSDFGELK